MLTTHPNAHGPARPLSAARVRELLELLHRFGGGHQRFRSSASTAAKLATITEPKLPAALVNLSPDHPLASMRRGYEVPRAELFRPDPTAVMEDFDRLSWLWSLTGECWTGAAGGTACCAEKIAATLAKTRKAGQGGSSPFAQVMEAHARQLESVTDQELGILGELSAALAAAFDADPSALNRVMAAFQATPCPDPAVIHPRDPEAREWLSSNGHEGPLAANRFGDRETAQAFVEELYDAGAERVVIATECIKNEPEHGGQYADGIRVRLPSGGERRSAVLAIVNREVQDEGFEAVGDEGQDVVFLWWD